LTPTERKKHLPEGTRDNVYFTDGAVLLYDPDAMTFAAYAIPE
jgi:hypothetical protein